MEFRHQVCVQKEDGIIRWMRVRGQALVEHLRLAFKPLSGVVIRFVFVGHGEPYFAVQVPDRIDAPDKR